MVNSELQELLKEKGIKSIHGKPISVENIRLYRKRFLKEGADYIMRNKRLVEYTGAGIEKIINYFQNK